MLLSEVLALPDQVSLPEGWRSVRRGEQFCRPLWVMGVYGVLKDVKVRVTTGFGY